VLGSVGGLGLNTIYGLAALVALAMAVTSFVVVRREQLLSAAKPQQM